MDPDQPLLALHLLVAPQTLAHHRDTPVPCPAGAVRLAPQSIHVHVAASGANTRILVVCAVDLLFKHPSDKGKFGTGPRQLVSRDHTHAIKILRLNIKGCHIKGMLMNLNIRAECVQCKQTVVTLTLLSVVK